MAGKDNGLRAILELAELASGPVLDEIFRFVLDYILDGGIEPEDPDYASALALLQKFRPLVAKETLGRAATAVRRRKHVPAELVELFLNETGDILAPLLGTVVMDDAGWLRVVAKASAEARRLLEERSDLSETIKQIVRAQSGATAPARDGFGSVPRADAVHKTGEGSLHQPQNPYHSFASSVSDARWETDRLGRVVFSDIEDGAAEVLHGAAGTQELIGQPLSRVFITEGGDIDQALERRVPFRDVRATVAAGPLKGIWTLAAVPYFDPVSGHYMGHRGIAQRGEQLERRPGRAQTTGEPVPRAYDAMIGGETLSTMAHEIRTPLNAIMGFAQLIEAQTIGAVPEAYRARAAGILTAAERLLGAIDSVQDVTRLRRGVYQLSRDSFHPAQVVEELVDHYRDHARRRGLYLVSRISTGLKPIEGDSVFLQRVLGRILVIVCDQAMPGETLIISVKCPSKTEVAYSLKRPRVALAAGSQEEVEPVDAGGRADSQRFDLSLRLIRELAAVMGGTLTTDDSSFTLTLSTASVSSPPSAQQVS